MLPLQSVKKGDFLNITVVDPKSEEDSYCITSKENSAGIPERLKKIEDTDDVNKKQTSVVTHGQGNRVAPGQSKKMGLEVEEEGLDCIRFERICANSSDARRKAVCGFTGADADHMATENICVDTHEDGEEKKTASTPRTGDPSAEVPTLRATSSVVPTTPKLSTAQSQPSESPTALNVTQNKPILIPGITTEALMSPEVPTEPMKHSKLPIEPVQTPELPTEPVQTPELSTESVQPSKLPIVQEISTLPGSFYDVVIFSLFLEYLPSPSQRLACCHKAYRLLKPGGILVLITPDSKHQNANAHLYKLWRLSLGFLGFSRVKYEKCKHFHGLLVRKALCRDAYVKDAERQLESVRSVRVKGKFAGIDYDKVKYEMYIPQDFKEEDSSDYSDENK